MIAKRSHFVYLGFQILQDPLLSSEFVPEPPPDPGDLFLFRMNLRFHLLHVIQRVFCIRKSD